MKQIKCSVCDNKTKKTCRGCGQPFCDSHLYFYVDESNIAITRNSPLLCKECYIKKYGNR